MIKKLVLVLWLLFAMSQIAEADTYQDFGIEFKTERIKNEFSKLVSKNPEFAKIVGAVQNFSVENFGKSLVITHLLRTKREQLEIYGENYKKTSFHQVWRGIDIRSRIYTNEEITKLITFMKTFNVRPLYHQIGNYGYHFHMSHLW